MARHLVASTLYAEDTWSLGPRAVWGSYFDVEKGSWGYACCKALQRQEVCSLAELVEEGEASSDEDGQAKALRAAELTAWEEAKLLDAKPVEPELKGSEQDLS